MKTTCLRPIDPEGCTQSITAARRSLLAANGVCSLARSLVGHLGNEARRRGGKEASWLACSADNGHDRSSEAHPTNPVERRGAVWSKATTCYASTRRFAFVEPSPFASPAQRRPGSQSPEPPPIVIHQLRCLASNAVPPTRQKKAWVRALPGTPTVRSLLPASTARSSPGGTLLRVCACAFW